MIVLDASVALEVVLCTPIGQRLFDRLFADPGTLHVPHLLDLELLRVLRRHFFARLLPLENCERAIANLGILPLTRYPHTEFLPRVWTLRHNLTAYDAAYVALAETLGATLLTRDARLAAASGHRARVEVV
jgi:predicted nucleic acid-binding protein